MPTLIVTLTMKTGVTANLDPGDLLDGEWCLLTDTGLWVYGLGGQNYYAVGPDLTAIEALSSTGFLRRVGTNSWVLTRPAPGDITQNGAVTGQAIIWNGTVWGPGTQSFDDLDDIPTDFPPSIHTHPLTDIEQSGATEGQVATWRGAGAGNWIADDPSVSPAGIDTSGATDLDLLQYQVGPNEWVEVSADAAGLVTKAGAQTVTGTKNFSVAQGFGTPDPEAEIHIKRASAGSVTASADSLLVLERDNAGPLQIEFITPSSEAAGFYWTNPVGGIRGAFAYDHNVDVILETVAGNVGPTLAVTPNGVSVGVGDGHASVFTPQALLALGNSLADAKLLLYDSGTGSAKLGWGVQAGQFISFLNASTDRYAFYDDFALTNEIMTLSGAGRLKLRQGLATGGNYMTVGGRIYQTVTAVGNVGTGEDDLVSFTLPANCLAADGDSVRLYVVFRVTGSPTATKQLRTYFGGSGDYDSGAQTPSGSFEAILVMDVARVSSSAANCVTTFLQNGQLTQWLLLSETPITGLDFTTTNIIKLTGEAAATGAATDDIIAVRAWLERSSAA